MPTGTNYLGIGKILRMNLFLHLACVDAHFPFILCCRLEFDNALAQRKKSVIPSDPDVIAWINVRAALAD